VKVETVHDEGGHKPAVQDISENEKIFLERPQHSVKDLIRTQFHHDLSQNDNESDEPETDVRAPSAEGFVDLKPEEFISPMSLS